MKRARVEAPEAAAEEVYLPRELKQQVLQFLDLPNYQAIAQVNQDWNHFLMTSHEHHIHRLLRDLIQSEAATRGSVYEQLRFIQRIESLLENLIPRMVGAGRSDGIFRSLLLRLEKRELRIAWNAFQSPLSLVSPLLIVAQSPRLSERGQESIYDLALRSNLFYRDRIWHSLASNPNLSPALLERLDERTTQEALPLHWGGYWHDQVSERLAQHPRVSEEKQILRFEQLNHLKFYPQRVAKVVDWGQRVNLSAEIQRQIFGSIIPELLALPREAHLPYLGRLVRVLARNRSLLEENRGTLFQLVFQGGVGRDGVVDRAIQEELLVDLASTSASEELQRRVWSEAERERSIGLEYRVLLGFSENPRIIEAMVKKIFNLLPRLSAEDRQWLALRMAEHPQLGDSLVAGLVDGLTPAQLAQVQADDPRVDLAMVLTKNQSLAKKSVDSLVGWVQGIQDPPTQKELIVNLLNHSSLTERTLDILEADCARMPENPFSPEWFLLRRGLYRVLPRVLRY